MQSECAHRLVKTGNGRREGRFGDKECRIEEEELEMDKEDRKSLPSKKRHITFLNTHKTKHVSTSAKKQVCVHCR